ncbi:Trk family potassium uptake protein [Alkalibacter sp. M17DMB]|nr:Trk family potassium uptake protein [Alkalibacter mobilis]
MVLSLPISSVSGDRTDLLTALFTATSAVCVTGLVVVDTGTYWSNFGQGVILFLIQIGGLGFMTMTTLIFLIAGKRITIKERILIKDSLSSNTLEGVVRFVKYILAFTFLAELAGAIVLAFTFIPLYGGVKGVALSIFHSVSAFCNAGFDLVGGFRSLTPFVNNISLNLTVIILIILGGLGFSVVNDVFKIKKFKRLNFHSKIVLSISAVLIITAFIIFGILESGNLDTVKDLPLHGKFLSTLFLAVTPRTAGFNTVDMASLTMGSLVFVIFLMFIGGSPGSTAGGVKTTTFGVLLYTLISVLRGRKETEVFGRTISADTVRRALSIIMIGMGLLFIDVLILTFTEDAGLVEIVFEAVSAFGTVGLSMGITPQLSSVGRVMIMITMFAGRVGPLTIAFAISEVQSDMEAGKYRYPEGKVIV